MPSQHLSSILFRGVNPNMHAELNGVLQPKTCRPFVASPKWGKAEWGNSFWGKSKENAVIEHQQHQAGFPTSGVSTTPYLSRAIFYATHGGKYRRAYVYVIDREQCKALAVSEFVVNDIVPYPSVVEDSEVILVAKDFGALPASLVVDVREVFI